MAHKIYKLQCAMFADVNLFMDFLDTALEAVHKGKGMDIK